MLLFPAGICFTLTLDLVMPLSANLKILLSQKNLFLRVGIYRLIYHLSQTERFKTLGGKLVLQTLNHFFLILCEFLLDLCTLRMMTEMQWTDLQSWCLHGLMNRQLCITMGHFYF